MTDRIAAALGPEDTQRFTDLVKRLPAYLRLVKQIVSDPNVPKRSKVFLGAGGVYALSPIDLVPGIIPVAGQLDDAYAILTGVKKSLDSMPPELAEKHLTTASMTYQDIEEDIALVISIAKKLARLVVRTGAKVGRAGQAAYRTTREAIRRLREQSA